MKGTEWCVRIFGAIDTTLTLAHIELDHPERIARLHKRQKNLPESLSFCC